MNKQLATLNDSDAIVKAATEMVNTDRTSAIQAIRLFAGERRNICFHPPTGLLGVLHWADGKTTLTVSLIKGVAEPPTGPSVPVSFTLPDVILKTEPVDELLLFATDTEVFFVTRALGTNIHHLRRQSLENGWPVAMISCSTMLEDELQEWIHNENLANQISVQTDTSNE